MAKAKGSGAKSSRKRVPARGAPTPRGVSARPLPAPLRSSCRRPRGHACLRPALIRTVADFPRPGIFFKDITPLLADPKGFTSSSIRWRSVSSASTSTPSWESNRAASFLEARWQRASTRASCPFGRRAGCRRRSAGCPTTSSTAAPSSRCTSTASTRGPRSWWWTICSRPEALRRPRPSWCGARAATSRRSRSSSSSTPRRSRAPHAGAVVSLLHYSMAE